MSRWKIIHIHIVAAPTRQEAIEKFVTAIRNNTVDDYFETEIIKKVEEPTGWIGKFKSQLMGKK